MNILCGFFQFESEEQNMFPSLRTPAVDTNRGKILHMHCLEAIILVNVDIRTGEVLNFYFGKG